MTFSAKFFSRPWTIRKPWFEFFLIDDASLQCVSRNPKMKGSMQFRRNFTAYSLPAESPKKPISFDHSTHLLRKDNSNSSVCRKLLPGIGQEIYWAFPLEQETGLRCIKNSFWKPQFKSLGEFSEKYLMESLRIFFYWQSLVGVISGGILENTRNNLQKNTWCNPCMNLVLWDSWKNTWQSLWRNSSKNF